MRSAISAACPLDWTPTMKEIVGIDHSLGYLTTAAKVLAGE